MRMITIDIYVPYVEVLLYVFVHTLCHPCQHKDVTYGHAFVRHCDLRHAHPANRCLQELLQAQYFSQNPDPVPMRFVHTGMRN